MNPEDRQRLGEKKARLTARLKRRSEGEFCTPVLIEMRRGGHRAARVSVSEQMAVVEPFTLLPGIDEHVDWSRIPGHQRRVWTEKNRRAAHLLEALRELGLSAQSRVLVVFHPSFAGIRTSVAAVIAHATIILDSNPEIWICSASGGDWVIEAAGHDICWARPAATVP